MSDIIYPSDDEVMEDLSTAGLLYEVVDITADEIVVRFPISDKKRLTSADEDCII
jgi:hypothetical protein